MESCGEDRSPAQDAHLSRAGDHPPALRLGDGYTYTLEEVGRIFKVTRERVRQIEAKAVRKLQHPVRSQQLASRGDRAKLLLAKRR
jgi:uncharacterized protein YtpQ (UPF0354 family)